jgi:tetratricopeptide (TPR) repeat protein
VTVAPTLGLLQTGSQAAADRFTYIPGLTLILLASAMIAAVLFRKPSLMWFVILTVAIGCGFGTVRQLAIWKDSVSMWEDVVENDPYVSQLAYKNLATAYKTVGRMDDALRSYGQALLIQPDDPEIHDGVGQVFLQENRLGQAIQEFKKAVALSRQTPPFYFSQHLWMAYEQAGMQGEALAAIQEVLKINPDFALGYSLLGITYWNQKQPGLSLAAFQKAYSLDPGNLDYLLSIVGCYKNMGQPRKAVEWLQQAASLHPQDPQILRQLKLAEQGLQGR